MNIATNARDAMPDGGGLSIETANAHLDTIRSCSHSDLAPGDYVMLAMTDSGTGMSGDVLRHIFEPFFTTREQGHGTGLGLATVYGIVKQNGGTVDVDSREGTGTTFRFYFPRFSDTAMDTLDTPAAIEMLGGSETILIAEDQTDVREFCRDVLLQMGYNVLTAASGEEALSVSEAHSGDIHLFMSDVILPGMNGRTAAERISASRPGIKVLYNSGYTAEVIDRQGILESGINFISKPFSSGELSRRVREILDSDK